jgi:hypothetical protein
MPNVAAGPTGGPPNSTSGTLTPPGQMPNTNPIRWVIGIAGVWLILTALVDFDTTAELGAGLGILIATTASMHYGPSALRQLGFLS